MSGTRRRGTYAKGRERREAILHAANEVFAAQGFHGAALSTIATRVGLSEPGLLRLPTQLIAMWDGVRVQWLLDPDEVDLAAVFEDFLDHLRPSRGAQRG